MKNDTKRSRIPLAAGLILFAAAALWALTRSFGCGADSIPGATNEQRIAYIELSLIHISEPTRRS